MTALNKLSGWKVHYALLTFLLYKSYFQTVYGNLFNGRGLLLFKYEHYSKFNPEVIGEERTLKKRNFDTLWWRSRLSRQEITPPNDLFMILIKMVVQKGKFS